MRVDADRRRAAWPTRWPSRRSGTGWPPPRGRSCRWSAAILDRHPGEPALVIGAYLDQLDELGEALDAPIIQGSTRNREREALYDRFRARRDPRAGRLQGGELLHRPARGERRRSRSRARSAPGRRRRSGSAGCCARRATAGRRTSTRWSPATRSTPTTPPTGSGSSPSRATPTGSSTPMICSARPFPICDLAHPPVL